MAHISFMREWSQLIALNGQFLFFLLPHKFIYIIRFTPYIQIGRLWLYIVFHLHPLISAPRLIKLMLYIRQYTTVVFSRFAVNAVLYSINFNSQRLANISLLGFHVTIMICNALSRIKLVVTNASLCNKASIFICNSQTTSFVFY